VVAALFGTASVAQAAGPALLGQWHMDSVVGDTPPATPDSAGGGHDLLACPACGMTTSADGKFSRYYDEANTIAAKTVGGLGKPQQVTLLAWIRRSGGVAGGAPGADEVIAAQAHDTTSCDVPSYRLRYDDGDAFSGLQFSAHVGGAVVSSPAVGTAEVWDGAWHLVAGTFDGSKVHLYVDANEVGNGTPATGSLEYATQTGAFGADGFTGNPTSCNLRDFTGGIDELRVYDTALKGSEIEGLATAPGPTPPVVIQDDDDDGVPNGSDNCPAVANSGQGDPNGNGVGAACEPPVARLSVAPNPTCVGSLTTLHAEDSTGDSPIVNYRFFFQESNGVVLTSDGFVNAPPVTVQVANGSASAVPQSFGWNHTSFFPVIVRAIPGIAPGYSYYPGSRDDVDMNVTVTSANGLTATAVKLVTFAQHNSEKSADRCPSLDEQLAGKNAIPPLTALLAFARSVQFDTDCPSDLSCVGTILMTGTGRRGFTTAGGLSSAKRKRPPLIGSQPYSIPAHGKAKIVVKLKKKARRFLAKHGKLRAKVTVVRISARGKLLAHSKKITLRKKKKKK
jgi:hypothetical protein